MKEKSNIFWFALIGLIILASAAALFYFNKNSGTTAVIYQGNEEIYRINLSEIKEPKRLVITCDDGTNVVLLENGRISIVQADCPDKLCVEQGAITTRGVPMRLVCRINCISILRMIAVKHYDYKENDDYGAFIERFFSYFHDRISAAAAGCSARHQMGTG